MKQLTQIIAAAASSLAVLLTLPPWPGAAESRTEMRQAAQQQQQQASTRTDDAGREARATYESKCATCHGKDGRAKTLKAKFNKARDLTDAAWQADVSDERIYNSIANGRGKKMPAFAKKLSRAEMDALVGYVRGLKK